MGGVFNWKESREAFDTFRRNNSVTSLRKAGNAREISFYYTIMESLWSRNLRTRPLEALTYWQKCDFSRIDAEYF